MAQSLLYFWNIAKEILIKLVYYKKKQIILIITELDYNRLSV